MDISKFILFWNLFNILDDDDNNSENYKNNY